MVSIFDADEPIHSGDLIYEISYAGIEQSAVFHHSLSEETPLPVRPGQFLLTHTELLPPVTPPVSITLPHNKYIYVCASTCMYIYEVSIIYGFIIYLARYRFMFSLCYVIIGHLQIRTNNFLGS